MARPVTLEISGSGTLSKNDDNVELHTFSRLPRLVAVRILPEECLLETMNMRGLRRNLWKSNMITVKQNIL